jgi:hypothetical protein
MRLAALVTVVMVVPGIAAQPLAMVPVVPPLPMLLLLPLLPMLWVLPMPLLLPMPLPMLLLLPLLPMLWVLPMLMAVVMVMVMVLAAVLVLEMVLVPDQEMGMVAMPEAVFPRLLWHKADRSTCKALSMWGKAVVTSLDKQTPTVIRLQAVHRLKVFQARSVKWVAGKWESSIFINFKQVGMTPALFKLTPKAFGNNLLPNSNVVRKLTQWGISPNAHRTKEKLGLVISCETSSRRKAWLMLCRSGITLFRK